MEETKNLIQGISEEIDRVKEIVKEYESLPNNSGVFASIFMKQSISMAEKARNQGDTIMMIKYFKELQEYEL